jgi:hypothetical protein
MTELKDIEHSLDDISGRLAKIAKIQDLDKKQRELEEKEAQSAA